MTGVAIGEGDAIAKMAKIGLRLHKIHVSLVKEVKY